MTTSPDQKIAYHDSSLSAFATGLFIGTLATLLLATDDGRKAGKKLLAALKDTAKDLSPEIEKLAPQITNTVNTLRNPDVLNRLHRSVGPTFTRSGQPVR